MTLPRLDPRHRGLSLVVLVLATAACVSANANESAEPSPITESSGSASSRTTVSVGRGSDGLEVEGRCRVPASRATVWAVLTDYDGIDRFVSSMRESRVTERTGDHLLVEQVATGRILLFKRNLRVVLKIQEQPQNTIRFEDVLHKDFVTYRGSWQIEAHGPEVEIVYRVTARPAFHIPDMLARGMFQGTVKRLLAEVVTEIGRRSELENRADGLPLVGEELASDIH